jgi:hypothetical protein
MSQELTALRLGPQACTPPAFEAGEGRVAPHPPPPPPHAILGVGRSIETIRSGPQGPHEGPAFEAWVPVCVRAGHATPLESPQQPPMVPPDLGQHALKAYARPHPLAAWARIFIHADHALTRPSPGDRPGPSGGWPCRGLDGLDAVVRMGRAHLHERQAAHVMVVERGRHPPDPHRLPRGLSQRAPPAGPAGWVEPGHAPGADSTAAESPGTDGPSPETVAPAACSGLQQRGGEPRGRAGSGLSL